MATTVTFDGVPATDVTVTDTTTLTAVVPAGTAAGAVDVVVATSVDSTTVTDAYTYAAPAATITSLEPNPAGSLGLVRVRLNGTGLATPAGTAGKRVGLYPAGSSTATVRVSLATNPQDTFADFDLTSYRNPASYPEGQIFDVTYEIDDVAIARLDAGLTMGPPIPAAVVDTFGPLTAPAGPSTTFTATGTFATPGVPGVRWGLIFYPTGTTADGNAVAVSASGSSETEMTFIGPSNWPSAAGVYDAYIAPTGNTNAWADISSTNWVKLSDTVEFTAA